MMRRFRFRFGRAMVFFSLVFSYVLLLAGCVFAVASDQVRSGFAGTGKPPADCALVFGTAVHGKGSPGPGIMRRAGTAVALYNEGLIKKIIMTGGKGSDWQESEAEVMKAYAVELGVPPEKIFVEEFATSTVENIVNTRDLTSDCSSILAISDRYHLARIKVLANWQGKQGMETYPALWNSTEAFEERMVLREAAGLLYYLYAL